MSAEPSSVAPGLPANLVLYDGVCGLCNRTVQFLLRHDRHARLCFAPLQGETAARLLPALCLAADLQTLIFVRGAGTPGVRADVRSSGVLEILRVVGGVWGWLGALRLVPRSLRDAVYDWVARHRYSWFGRLDAAAACRLPSGGSRARFLP